MFHKTDKSKFEKESDNTSKSQSGCLVSLLTRFNRLSPVSLVTQLFVGVCVVNGFFSFVRVLSINTPDLQRD